MANTARIDLASKIEILATSDEVDGGAVFYTIDDNAPTGRLEADMTHDLLVVDDLSWNPSYGVTTTPGNVITTIGDGYDGLSMIPASGTVTGEFVVFVRIIEALNAGTPDCFLYWLGDSLLTKLEGVDDYIFFKTQSRDLVTSGTKQILLGTTNTASSCNVEFFFGRIG